MGGFLTCQQKDGIPATHRRDQGGSRPWAARKPGGGGMSPWDVSANAADLQADALVPDRE